MYRDQIAVIIPCHNEASSIAKVVKDCREMLPHATVYVCDNNSTDETAELAVAAGAVVKREKFTGKGNAVRRMFCDVDAEIYVLVDGDDTYDQASVARLVNRLQTDGLDMVVGVRAPASGAAYRPGHRLGNYILTKIVRVIFGDHVTDMLSGYRVFSRRFVKSFPALAEGFEIETELTVHALELRMPIAEVTTRYRERPPSSMSKLHTIRDGWRILRTIFSLIKQERPFPFFATMFTLLASAALALAWPVLATFLETGLVPRLPTAVLATGMMLLAFLSLACGIILDTVTRGRREMKRLHYLSIPPVDATRPVTIEQSVAERYVRSAPR